MRYLVAGLLSCCIAAVPDKTVKQSQFTGKNVKEEKVKVLKEQLTVKKGDAFSIKLESNRSTGYSWQLLGPNYGPVELKKSHYQEPDAKLRGAPGTDIFEFKATKPNEQVVLIFNYYRPFEGLGKECYELKVKVEE
jgi:predicted secreted protein